MIPLDTIIQGDCLEELRKLPSEAVDCCITSPPYYGLRNYGCDGQIGLEKSPEAYLSKLVEVFREVRRVLKKEGTLWLNLGDSYSDIGRQSGKRQKDAFGVERPEEPKICERCGKEFIGGIGRRFCSSFCGGFDNSNRSKRPGMLKHKDLIGIPWMVAFALRADGWYLRSDIIWHKPNCMPESVTDRPTKSHEYIFLLSKSQKYYYDNEAIKEESITNDPRKPYTSQGAKKLDGREVWHSGERRKSGDFTKRNKRTVWTVATKPYSEAHFATFPEKLIEPCILAGCPEDGICLDPFFGAGTTGLVAKKLGRHFVGIELNEAYIGMAQKRVAAVPARLDRWAEV